MNAPKEQFCDWCGESMGVFAHSRRFDGALSCGQSACNRYARAADDEERQAAHDALDEERGWR